MSDAEEPKKKKQKTSKKDRKSTDSGKEASSEAADAPTYEERCLAINILASPLASKKSTKKAHKLVRKVSLRKIPRNLHTQYTHLSSPYPHPHITRRLNRSPSAGA